MKNKLIIAVTVPLFITLSIQAYLLVRLNMQVYHLSAQINQLDSSQLTLLPKFSKSTPVNPVCENVPDSHRGETF